jgi:hypothetical protein
MIEQRATTDQEINLIRKMISMLEKQTKATKRPDDKRRLQEKLEKQTKRLNELTSMKNSIIDEDQEGEEDLDNTRSTLDVSSFASNHDDDDDDDDDAGQEQEWIGSPRSSPPPPPSPKDTTAEAKSKKAVMPYNVVHSTVDAEGNRILKLEYLESL